MDPEQTERRDERAEDLLALVEQACAGVLLVEELLDEHQPGWDAAPGRRRSRAGADGPLGYVRSALHNAWLNAGWVLCKQYDLEPWRIPPLAMREPGGGYSLWSRAPDGRDVVEEVEDWSPERLTPTRPVRAIWPPEEPRYTLEQAKTLLGLGPCRQHDWHVETDERGTPVAVTCSRPACGESRDVFAQS